MIDDVCAIDDSEPPSAADGSLREAAFRCSMEGILIADQEARYVDVNDAACQILGRTREELLHARVGDFVEYKGDIPVVWEKAMRGGRLRAEISVSHPDGKPRQLEFSAVANIQPGRHMVLVRDVTHRRTLDEQIRNASKMEAIGRLAGGVAHDFNNLLMVISSYTELILDSLGEQDPLRRKANEVLKASSRAAALTRQLLAFSRRQVLDPQLQDLNGIVQETAKMLGRVLGEGISLDLSLNSSLDKIHADRGQIEQILLHLAANARDWMPDGGHFTISTSNAEIDCASAPPGGSPPAGQYVLLMAEDTAAGMSGDVLSHIFEPFFSPLGFGEGHGLGLAAVYGIVKQSGGYVWVESEIGKGNRFRMYFPVARVSTRPGPAASSARSSARVPVVLLVEDEEALRMAAADFLSEQGFQVFKARNGDEALSLLSSSPQKVDVMITDLVMPGISGRLLSKEVQRLHPATRILYMSGYNRDPALGAQGDTPCVLLQKPFRLELLSEKIREMLCCEVKTLDRVPSRQRES